MVPDMEDPAQRSGAELALDKLFRHVLSLGGVISGEHGIGLAKRAFMTQAFSPATLEMMRGIKQLFDPDGKLVAKASATQAPKPFKRF